MNPLVLKYMLNVYPPYWGTGIRVAKISADYRELIVLMKLHWYNRNYVRTHFGGSLYAMTDPFLMLMLMQVLGREYIVWDQTARIEFIKPGRGTVRVKFLITDDDVTAIKACTAHGEKYLPEFTVAVCDDAGETVCRVTKTLYVRRKPWDK
jgi:acyl-coenzyme A thioesterase PaaI-like protein